MAEASYSEEIGCGKGWSDTVFCRQCSLVYNGNWPLPVRQNLGGGAEDMDRADLKAQAQIARGM